MERKMMTIMRNIVAAFTGRPLVSSPAPETHSYHIISSGFAMAPPSVVQRRRTMQRSQEFVWGGGTLETQRAEIRRAGEGQQARGGRGSKPSPQQLDGLGERCKRGRPAIARGRHSQGPLQLDLYGYGLVRVRDRDVGRIRVGIGLDVQLQRPLAIADLNRCKLPHRGPGQVPEKNLHFERTKSP